MNMYRRTTVLSTVSAALVLSACAAGMGASPTNGAPSFSPPNAGGSKDAVSPSRPIEGLAEDLVADVIDEAAAGAGVDASQVQVVAAEAVIWSDGSIGCPEPGMMYTQALVPGYRVVVEVDGEALHFHAAETGGFRFCADPQPPLDRESTGP